MAPAAQPLTRADWEAHADRLLAGVRPFMSADGALYDLPGPRQSNAGRLSDGVEGYARTFLLAAFRLAGAGGVGVPGDLADRYGSGAAAGPTRWTRAAEVRQTMVEAASIAIGLFETRPWIWDSLSQVEQERLAGWLLESTKAEPHPNNWVLFQVMINLFLASVGAPHDPAQVERNLELVDGWYRGGGWYSDGAGQSFDHYCGWAMHLYTGLACRMGVGGGQAEAYRQRLRLFLDDFACLFGADGAPLHQGRSLTYRFAALAAPWLGALLDATPLAPGVTRRLANRCLTYFLDRGALSDQGLLAMGWHGQFEPVTQFYSGPASPYWASKGFLGLLLPPDHPAWTADEEPLPVERGDFVRVMQAPGWMAWGTATDGIVRVANHGSDRHPTHDDRMRPHYRRLAHATAAGPDLPHELADNEVVLPGGRVRRRIHRLGVGRSAFFPNELDKERSLDERIETASFVRGAAEVRVVHAMSARTTAVRLAGWSVADDAAPPAAEADGVRAVVRTSSGLTSCLVGLHGFDKVAVEQRVGANPYGRYSAVPSLDAADGAPFEQVFAALVVLTAEPLDDALPQVKVDWRTVTVRWPDGHVDTVELG